MKPNPKRLPFKLNAKMDGKKVIIGKDDFEYLLLCLCSQKFIHEAPPNGDAIAMGKKKYKKIQDEAQETIDNVYDQCMNFLHSSKTINKRQANYVKKYGYGG